MIEIELHETTEEDGCKVRMLRKSVTLKHLGLLEAADQCDELLLIDCKVGEHIKANYN